MPYKHIVSLDWKDITGGAAYLYGSHIQFNHGEVVIENPTIASGKPIKTFQSRTNYQGDRRWPELPLLIPNHNYQLDLDMIVEPEGRYFIQLDFKDRRDDLITTIVLKGANTVFTCSEGTFIYTIQLMTAGCQKVIFRRLTLLKEIDDEAMIMIDSQPAQKYETKELPESLAFVRNLITTND